MSEIAQLYRSESYSHRVAAEVRGHAARQGIMQKELARILGMHPSQITARMRGRTAFTLDELAVLARVFGIQPADLMPECTVRDSNPEPADFAIPPGDRSPGGLVLLGSRVLSIVRTPDPGPRPTGRTHPRTIGRTCHTPGAA